MAVYVYRQSHLRDLQSFELIWNLCKKLDLDHVYFYLYGLLLKRTKDLPDN